MLEPLFLKYGVSVVFAGHDHFYERIKPQKGIVHFVVGSGGQLRKGNIDREHRPHRVRQFDTEQAFLVAEIDGDELYFNAISRAGTVIDSGVDRAAEAVALQAEVTAFSSFSAFSDFSAAIFTSALVSVFCQSASNTSCIFFAIARLADDDADLAPAVQLQLAQALAADERRGAVADDGAHVQPQARAACAPRRPAALLSTLPIIRISTPALARSCERLQHQRGR